MKYKLKKISGDASFREFYRLKKNKKTSIIVSAKKEKFKNLAVYVVINNILNHNRINAPKLLKIVLLLFSRDLQKCLAMSLVMSRDVSMS